MLRRVRLVPACGLDQPAAAQDAQGLLDGALGEAGVLGDLAVAQADGGRALGAGAAPEEQVHEERRGAAVVADQVAEQDIDDVAVEAEGVGGDYHFQYYSEFRGP